MYGEWVAPHLSLFGPAFIFRLQIPFEQLPQLQLPSNIGVTFLGTCIKVKLPKGGMSMVLSEPQTVYMTTMLQPLMLLSPNPEVSPHPDVA